MTRHPPEIVADTHLSERLWREAREAASEEIPFDDPDDAEILAWLAADYLDIELAVTSDYSKVYHTDSDCDHFPEEATLTRITECRECGNCSGRRERLEALSRLRDPVI